MTDLKRTGTTVEEAAQAGRDRWRIENEGFNTQKTSALNLEHVDSTEPEKLKSYYLVWQIAPIIIQLLERGSLLVQLAQRHGRRRGSCTAA